MQASRTKRAASGTATAILQYLLLIGTQIILSPLVLHTSGQETLGAYSVLLQIVAFVSLVDLGFGIALNRFLAQAASVTGDLNAQFIDVFTIGRTYFLLSNTVACLALVAITLGGTSFFNSPNNLQDDFTKGLIIMALWTVIRTPLAVYGIGLTATQHQSAANMSFLSGNVLRLSSAIVFLYLGWGLTGLILANVLAEAATFSVQRLMFYRQFPSIRIGWGVPDMLLAKNMFRFGGATSLLTFGSRLTYSSDGIIVGGMFGASIASVYYSTQMPAFVIFSVIFRLIASAEPAVNELVARNDLDALRRAYLKLQRYTILSASAAACGYFLLGESAISLWVGPAQFGGDFMLATLALFIVLVTWSNIDYTYMIAFGKLKRLSSIVALEGLINIILSIILGLAIGFPGVMLATLLILIPRSVYQSVQMRGMLNVTLPEFADKVLHPVIAPLLAMALIVITLKTLIGITSWLDLLVVSGISTAGYASVAFTKSLTSEERNTMIRMGESLSRLTRTLS